MTRTPIGLNSIPNKTDIKSTVFGKIANEIKKIPIISQRKEYTCSRYFLLTNNNIMKIMIMPIKNAINLECKDNISFIF